MKRIKIQEKILLCIVISISLFFSACEKEIEYEVLSGQFRGVVYYRGYYGLEGVNVKLEGSSQEIVATTGEDGIFIIDNLKSGTYNIIFDKDGFCQQKIIGYMFVGGNKPMAVRCDLFPLPYYQIESIEIDTDYLPGIGIKEEVSRIIEGERATGRYYLSDKPEVSYEDYISTYYASVKHIENGTFRYQVRYNETLFPPGTVVYLIAYPASAENMYYTDIDTGKRIYTTININNPSNVVSFTVPVWR